METVKDFTAVLFSMETGICFAVIEALPGVMGNRGIMSFISGEQGNSSPIMKGTGE